MTTTRHRTIVWKLDRPRWESQELIGEEPLAIRIQGHPYSVIMRTPGDEQAHAAGFCLSEGIVDRLDQIGSLGYCDGVDTNTIAITLTAERRKDVDHLLDRRGYISQSSCGICGRELVQELYQQIHPVDKESRITPEQALDCIDHLSDHQPLRGRSLAAHAAVLMDERLDVLSTAEDLGRHNALDKTIGKAFLQGDLDRAAVLVLSSRMSYEMVQKAARAKIPIVLAISRPTAMAVSLASQLNMTLACLARPNGLFVYDHGRRLGFGNV